MRLEGGTTAGAQTAASAFCETLQAVGLAHTGGLGTRRCHHAPGGPRPLRLPTSKPDPGAPVPANSSRRLHQNRVDEMGPEEPAPRCGVSGWRSRRGGGRWNEGHRRQDSERRAGACPKPARVGGTTVSGPARSLREQSRLREQRCAQPSKLQELFRLYFFPR